MLQSKSTVSIIEGLQGSGKSTLVSSLLHSAKVQNRYVDGIIVIGVSAQSSLPAVLLRIYDALVYQQSLSVAAEEHPS